MQAHGACYVGPHMVYSGYIKLYTNRWVIYILAGDCAKLCTNTSNIGGGGNFYVLLTVHPCIIFCK